MGRQCAGERWRFQQAQARQLWGLQRHPQGSLVLARLTGERPWIALDISLPSIGKSAQAVAYWSN